MKRKVFAWTWTWKNDVVVLLLLGVLFAVVYAPAMLLAWILLFVAVLVIGHLVWLNDRITIDEELATKLTAEAETRGLSFTQAVEELIRDHFKKE